MEFQRAEAKRAARESMRTNRPSPLLVTLVYLALLVGATGLVNLLTESPVNEMLDYLYIGYDPGEIVEYLFFRDPVATSVYGAAALVLALYRILLRYGYTSYALALSRNQNPEYRRLFDGFARPVRVLAASLLADLLTFAWTLAFALPAGVVFFLLLAAVGDSLPEFVLTLYFLLAGTVAVLGLLVSFRYRLAPYFLLDNAVCTVRGALRQSREAMRGRTAEFLLLTLSFLPWDVLVTATGGAAGVWVFPYEGATLAHFYAVAAGFQRAGEDGGYTGQIYKQ